MGVKRNNFTTASLEIEQTEIEKKVMDEASLSEKKKGKGGRKKKDESDKANLPLVGYFTKEQKETIQSHCDQLGISFSALVKQSLVKEGIL